jgi:hypothetical protein
MDIVDAAKVLRAAPSPDDDTKRRRAIGMLVAAGIPPAEPRGSWSPRKVHNALEAIGAPLEELARQFIGRRREFRIPPTEEEIGTKQWLAYEGLNQTVGPWQPKCCACLRAWDVDPKPDPADKVAMLYFKIAVTRPQAKIQKLLDPQSWSSCSPQFFESSWATKRGLCSSPCKAGKSCGNDQPQSLPSPPPIGSEWKGRLFEHFRHTYLPGAKCVGFPGHQNETSVRNKMCVEASKIKTTGLTGEVYQVDYGVCGSIDSSMGDCLCETGGVDVDCGRTQTWIRTTSPESVWVSGVKYLKFSKRQKDYDLDAWTPVGLNMMKDEIVEDGVCCSITGAAIGPGAAGNCSCSAPVLLENVTPQKAPLCGP